MSKKNEEAFIDKFKDRIESIGKDGIASIMKNVDIPINKMEFQGNINDSNLLKYLNLNSQLIKKMMIYFHKFHQYHLRHQDQITKSSNLKQNQLLIVYQQEATKNVIIINNF